MAAALGGRAVAARYAPQFLSSPGFGGFPQQSSSKSSITTTLVLLLIFFIIIIVLLIVLGVVKNKKKQTKQESLASQEVNRLKVATIRISPRKSSS